MTPPAPADRVTVLEGKVDTLSDRVDTLAGRIDTLVDRVDTLTDRVDTLAIDTREGFTRVDAEFVNVRTEMRTGFQALEYQIGASEEGTHAAIRGSQEETRRQMRILHEEVLDRIARLGEGR